MVQNTCTCKGEHRFNSVQLVADIRFLFTLQGFRFPFGMQLAYIPGGVASRKRENRGLSSSKQVALETQEMTNSHHASNLASNKGQPK